MKRILVATTTALAIACGAVSVVAADDGLDVTMRVLDDAHDVDAVIGAIDATGDAAKARRGHEGQDAGAAREQAPKVSASRDSGADSGVRAEHGDGGDALRPRHDALEPGDEQHREGAIEDHDVPQVPATDAPSGATPGPG